MLTGIELMQWIEHFGRWNVQEFVAKSQDMRDVLTYLKAERSLELAEIMPFATSDSVRFEKRTSFTPVSEESWNMCRRWINSELWKSGFDYTDIVGCDGEFFL